MPNRTCLWCDKGQKCEYYHKVIAKEASKLLGQDATQLRQYIASVCPDYIQEAQRFSTYSNGEPYNAYP